MAKPILFVTVSKNYQNQLIQDTFRLLKKATDNEYHVLILRSNTDEHSINCLNDNKGLKDEDIEKLCNEIKNMYTQNQSGLQLKNDLVELEKKIYNLVRDYQNKYNIDVEGSFKNNKETGCISLDIKAEIKP